MRNATLAGAGPVITTVAATLIYAMLPGWQGSVQVRSESTVAHVIPDPADPLAFEAYSPNDRTGRIEVVIGAVPPTVARSPSNADPDALASYPTAIPLSQVYRGAPNLPSLSATAIVDLGYAAVYPSPEGLVRVSQGGAEVITQGLFTREQWSAFTAYAFTAARYDGRYLLSCNDGSGRKLLEIDLTGAQPTLIRHDAVVHAVFMDVTGALFIRTSDREIRRWEDPAAALRSYRWRSRLLHFPAGRGWGVIQIDGETGGDFAARIYADGALVRTVTKLNRPQRMPMGVAERWEIEVEADREVTAISLGTSMLDLEAG